MVAFESIRGGFMTYAIRLPKTPRYPGNVSGSAEMNLKTLIDQLSSKNNLQ